MKNHDLPLTLTRQTLFDIRCVYLCLCLFISICTSGQDLDLQRTWMLERSGEELNVHKSMAVQKSGDHFAVVYQNEREHTFVVYLHYRTTAMKWRTPVSDPGVRSKVIAIAFSEMEDAVYVLIKEGETRPRGRLIKYPVHGEVDHLVHEVWSIPISGNYPQVLLPTSDGAVIVAGYALDPTPVVVPGASPMYVAKYSPSWGEEIWYENHYQYGRAITAPIAMVESADHTIYVTGTATNDPSLYANSVLIHYENKMFTAALNTDNGAEVWHKVATYPDLPVVSGHGIAIEPIPGGVAVLGQAVLGTYRYFREMSSTSVLEGGRTILIGYAASNGDELWRVSRPSSYLQYPDLLRNNLARDAGTDELYMAYRSSEGPAHPVVEKFSSGGAPIWSRAEWPEWPVAETEILSLSYSRQSDKLFLGARIARRGLGGLDVQNQVVVLSGASRPVAAMFIASGILREGTQITQLETVREPDETTHPNDAWSVLACGSTRVSTTTTRVGSFVERYELIDAPATLRPFAPFGHFSFNFLDETALRVDASCLPEAPCVDLAIEAHASQFGKEIWSKEFTKSTEIILSPTGIPTTYGLRFEVDKEFQEVITLDETLFSAGVKGVHIETDTKDQSLTIKSTTDGQQVPFKLTLLNSQGKSIKEYSLTAPDQNVITDQQAEPVARLLLSADIPFQMSVYPNPSNGEFTVETSKQKESTTSVSVMDMSGYKIYQQPVASGEKLFVKLGSPKPGLYVLVVKNGSFERRQLIEIKY